MANAHSLAGLTKWVHREEWADAFNSLVDRHLSAVCATADIAIDQLPGSIGEQHFMVLWACIFEDFLARDLDGGRNIVDDYLKRRGWKESASNKAYMVALRSSVMSLYEVSGIVRDESFLARDLVRGGEPVRVREKSGTRSLKPWDRIAARIVQVGRRMEMAGGVLLFDHNTSETAVKALRRAVEKARAEVNRPSRKVGHAFDSALLEKAFSGTEVLRASAFMFTQAWLNNVLQRSLNPTLPKMCNSDGDELVFATVSYPLTPEASADAIERALATIPTLRPESESFWNWVGPRARARPTPADSQTIVTTLDDGSLVLGTVELKDRMLVLEVNSRQRAVRGQAMIEPVLGALVRNPQTGVRTVDQLMTSPPSDGSRGLSCGLSSDEERALVHANLDLHYTNLLDEPVPMLGNITPLKAAKTAKGREKLVAWLKYLENSSAKHEAESPMAGYDIGWMWARLGIAELRR